MNARPLTFTALAACVLLSIGSTAFAQSWPTKPLTLVVGTPPGGAVDAYARPVAEQMSRTLGRPVVVDNKPGAAGNISAESVVKSPADGYTLWVGTAAMTTINPSAFDNLRWKMSDFVGVIRGVEAPLVLVTHPSVPAKTLAELVAWVRANPDKIAYASFSPGTPSHFLGHQLNERFGLDMVHVPFKGSAPQVTNLLGGQVLLGFSQIQTTQQHVKAGKLTAIAVTSAKRSRFLPDAPTFAELGQPDFTTTIWFGLFARAGTPPEALSRIVDTARQAHADPDTRSRLEKQGFDVSGLTGSEFAATIQTESERWGKLVKATGFKAGD